VTDPSGPAGPTEAAADGRDALKGLLTPIRGHLLAGRILAAASGILAVAPYLALVRLGDLLLGAAAAGTAPDADEVRGVTVLLVGTFLAQLGCLFFALLITHLGDLRLARILRERLVERIAHAPLAWFSQATSGRIRKAVQDDTKALHTLVAHAPVETMAAVVTPLALTVTAFVIDWRLGLIAIAMVPIYLGIQMSQMRGMGEKTAEMDARLGTVSQTAVEFADGIAVVKAFGQVGRAHGRFATAAREFADFYYDWCSPMLRAAAVAQSFVSVAMLVLVNVGLGSLLVLAGWVAPADLIATTLISLVIPGTVNVISSSMWAYQLAGGAAVRIRDTLETPGLDEGTAQAPESAGVEFDDVTFSYGEGLALDGVRATLEPGTVTALIGQSGSGKSTMATMLARFQDPTSGAVRVGGVDLRDLTTRDLYRTVSFVLQDPQLLRVSVRENIRLARPDASDAEVLEAARAANIAAEIEALPRGLDTVYGDETQLSGGQAQRIAIARAVLADAPVLVLDEALAATDADAEAEIQSALTRLVADRTVLVVAHRPESVRGADQVLLLDRGRIVQRLRGDEVTDAALDRIMESEATRA
jgi:ATP-binding cassette subfamily B protein